MQEFTYEYFLPYPIEDLWNAMQNPENLTLTPGTEQVTVEMTGIHSWRTSRVGSTDGELIVTDNVSTILPQKYTIMTDITSHTKNVTDTCVLQLFRVGDLRTRLTITYRFRYKLFHRRHILTRIQLRVTKGAMVNATATRVKDKIISFLKENTISEPTI